jgi:hypothetical protein
MPRGKHGNHRRGKSHPRWNPDKIISSHGYVKVRVGVGHEFADPNWYAYEHLLTWIAAGRRRPKVHEVIHHKNDNKKDNRLDNLEIKTRVDHGILHSNGLSDFDVLAIREMYARGNVTMKRIAIHFGTRLARVSKIIRGEARMRAGGPISTNNR